MRPSRLGAAVALVTALAAAAQQPSPFGEVLEVRVTNVDVVVTGRNGDPVPGLAPSDFEIYENGKRQDITHFAEYAGQGGSAVLLGEGGAPPVEIEPAPSARRFIFYFDDATLDLGNRHAVYPAVRKFLAANLRPGDQAMVVTWNHELHVRVPWTTDLKAVDDALAAVAAEAPSGSVLRTEKQRTIWLMTKMADEMNVPGSLLKPTWEEIESAAHTYAERYLHDITRSTNALTRLLGSLAGAEGRKVLVMATQTLPTVAGAELFEHYENLRAAAMVPGNPGTRPGGRDSRLANFSRFNVQQKVEMLARAANAAGVTIYGVNPKGLDGPVSGKVEQQNPTDANLQFAEAVQALQGIKMLAELTGGVAMVGAPADMVLARVGRDLDAYYSLGYRSKPGAAAERKIEVRAKRPGLKVRARTNVYYRSLEREMADRVIANHLQSSPANELGVSLEADPVTTNGAQRLRPVRVVIPMDKLTLLPDGKGNMTGGFSVFTCSGDGEGGTSGVNVQSQAIVFTAAQAAQMQGRRIGFAIQVPLEKGRHQISVGVVDHVSQGQGFATLK
jgi:VWFA-related protein